jgi:hypothetical protein
MTGLQETGIVTGTRDKDYNLVSYVQSCMKSALRLETYRQDAERDGDTELVELFTKAQADSRKGAEIGKDLLATRLSGDVRTPPTGGTDSGNEPPTDVMAPDQATPE